jgi:tRNA threonylcarbamoyladenosine biosynthesis protein TsaB
MSQNGSFLAFDTSTDVMSIALTDSVRIWQHTGPGGAKASSSLIPAILTLLTKAGLALGDLQAIAFGRGPGSFSGLRTACAVAQGLAFAAKGATGANSGMGGDGGIGIPVLPIDTLMALAEEARHQQESPYITALLDARMDEMYVQRYACLQGILEPLGDCELIRPENLVPDGAALHAGNVFGVYRGRLSEGLNSLNCLPTAAAMLRLAPRLVASGHCVPAFQALPLYVRDKVALTTAEREHIKTLKLQAV